MAEIVVFTNTDDGVLPALALLSHDVHQAPQTATGLANAAQADVLLADARNDLPGARQFCSVYQAAAVDIPLILVLTEGGLAAVNADWGVADVILSSAGPAEIDARIRLASVRVQQQQHDHTIRAGGLSIDETSYSARVNGKLLDLTYKEFELLRYLAGHPSRVFTREQLLSEVWGYDYFGGTRTVDVHVRRLRAKLGELDSLIGTVRNVGYRFMAEDREDG